MPRLSDKHIDAIRKAAEDNDQTYGFGDVILLCDELQERRKNGENVPTALLGDRLLERLTEGSSVTQRTGESLIELLKTGRVKEVWEVNDEVTNTTLMEELIKRVNDKEAISDALVLALFHALQKKGYFQTICWVNREALGKVLDALEGPGHILREMQVTRCLPQSEGETPHPITQLRADMGAQNADS